MKEKKTYALVLEWYINPHVSIMKKKRKKVLEYVQLSDDTFNYLKKVRNLEKNKITKLHILYLNLKEVKRQCPEKHIKLDVERIIRALNRHKEEVDEMRKGRIVNLYLLVRE